MASDLEINPGAASAGEARSDPPAFLCADADLLACIEELKAEDRRDDMAWFRVHPSRKLRLRLASSAELYSRMFREWALVAKIGQDSRKVIAVTFASELVWGVDDLNTEAICRALLDHATAGFRQTCADEQLCSLIAALRVQNGLDFWPVLH
jgi:hypothetical protein